MNEYQKQAKDFLAKAKANVKIELAKNQEAPLWHKENEKHGLMYNITIEREKKQPWQFNFWDSIHNREKIEELEDDSKPVLKENINRLVYPTEPGYWLAKQQQKRKVKEGQYKPNEYDILACIEKYDPESFEDFCANFGYDEDSKTAEKTFIAVNREYHNVMRLFGDMIEDLREIN